MLVLITYDVTPKTPPGAVACGRSQSSVSTTGNGLQNSVFECLLDAAQCKTLQAKLLTIMDAKKDSLRFYYLGKRYENKIEHFGCKQTYMPRNP